jgi:hypothetical protein
MMPFGLAILAFSEAYTEAEFLMILPVLQPVRPVVKLFQPFNCQIFGDVVHPVNQSLFGGLPSQLIQFLQPSLGTVPSHFTHPRLQLPYQFLFG